MPTLLKNTLKKYHISVSASEAEKYIQEIKLAQQHFPEKEQQALIVKLLKEWDSRNEIDKILIFPIMVTKPASIPIAHVFGIISSDWPGLSDSCIGVIHEKGWNIYSAVGLTISHREEKLGILLICLLFDAQEGYALLQAQTNRIIDDIKKAAVGSKTKESLLSEEIKKLQLYSNVIDKIQDMYKGQHIDDLTALDGEALKFFSARSRDYIENRPVEVIAGQIIHNYKMQQSVRESKTQAMQVEIENFKTKKEGVFTSISIAGKANQVLLDDCLKSIETYCPGFRLMHQKSFTSDDGITVHRFEILTAEKKSLNTIQIENLRRIFKNMEITKQRERQSWLESIGGFEHYARAIIPFLVRENELSNQTQVYLSVNQTTEKVIDFKILIVMLPLEVPTKKLIYQCVKNLDSIEGFSIASVKPPKAYVKSEFTILDLRVDLSLNPEIDKVYSRVKQAIKNSIGDFRDFDEGMRDMDMMNLMKVRRHLHDEDEDFVREFYYSLEDFYRVSAPIEEIGIQLKLCQQVLNAINSHSNKIHTKWAALKNDILSTIIQAGTIVIIAYPEEADLLGLILAQLEKYEVIISKLSKKSYNILICKLSENGKALRETDVISLLGAISKEAGLYSLPV
ncbi:hypothetical protein JXJ21_02960 [candidate division KSB1 bacterium]|nr:hypothetical protein [candidate division KSB1 bacterium]